MKTYEAMFLLDPSQPNFEVACEPIKRVFERSSVEVIKMTLWDEARLAYEIEGRKRGLYVLTYFKMDPENVTKLERDCQLSEEILRVLVLRKDKLTDAELNAQTPAEVAALTPAEERTQEQTAPEAPAKKEEAPAAAEEAPAEEGPEEQPAE